MALDVEDIPLLIICLLIMFGIVFGIGIIRDSAVDAEVNTHSLEQEIFMKKLVNYLSYEDPSTGRIYYGVINENSFSSEYLNNIFGQKEDFAFKITIKDLEGEKLAIDAVNYLSEFKLLEVIADKSEGYTKFEKNNYVIFKKKTGEEVQAKMAVTLIFR